MSVNINRAGVAAVGGAGIRPNLFSDTLAGSTYWYNANGNGSYAKETIIDETGTPCCRYIINTKATNWCVFAFAPSNMGTVRQYLHDNPNTTLTLSFDARSSVPMNGVNPTIKDTNAQNNFISFSWFTIPTADTWVHYIGTGTILTEDISAQVLYMNKLFEVGTYDFKNVKLEVGDTATPYCLSESEGFIAASFAESSSTPPSFGKNWISVKDFTEI